MGKIFDIIIPRFITEDVAFVIEDGEYIPVCSTKDLSPCEKPDAIGTVRSFNILGFSIMGRLVGDLRDA